jgi:radical SAM protein with 4Fe4S-binding SPASM domain
MSNKINSLLAPSFLPSTAVLEMTSLCNHQCLFCSCPWEADRNEFSGRPELSVSQWKEAISLLCEKGISRIAFTGGEPLMKEGITEIISFAASCRATHTETENDSLVTHQGPPKLYLISNGELVSDEILDLCYRHKIHLSMSLPGLTTFEFHTGTGSPELILDHFSKAKKKGVTTTVNVTVTKKNLFELYETIARALIAGADTLLMNRFLPGGRGLEFSSDLVLNKEEINQMLDIAEEVLATSRRKGSVGTELPKCILKRNDYQFLEVGTRCSAGIDFFVIGPAGWIRTCNHSPVELVPVMEFEKLRDHPYWRKFIMKEYHPEMCQGCHLLFDCDGGCREAAHICNGSVNSPDPVFNP